MGFSGWSAARRFRTGRALASLACAALVATSLATVSPATANPAGTGLVISEVYGAGGISGAVYNADFVEIHNPTPAAIDLSGTYVAYRSATGGFGGSLALKGVLPADGRYLVRMSTPSATNGVALPTPDRIASPAISMASPGGQVFLQETAAPFVGSGNLAGAAGVIDMVGLDAGASGATSFETAAGPAATTAQSANRSAAGTDTDNNAVDFTLAAPSPVNCGCVPAPGTFTGSIAEIQGTDTDTSPRLDDTVTTQGVVTAVYVTGGLNGFYMQTEGTGGSSDATPGASDAIFVFGNNATSVSPVVGDFVSVTGPVAEFAGSTQIVPATGGVTKINGDPHTDPTPFVGALPGSDCALGACPTTLALEAAREAREGELYAPTGPFTVTNSFSLTNGANGFMEIGLAADDEPLVSPTEVEDFQTGQVTARAAYNGAHAITLDDGSSLNYTTSSSGIPMPWISPTYSVRVGAAATFNAPVVLEYRNNVWKLQPQSQITDTGTGTVSFEQTRTAAPEDVGGDLKLATFNVLNYFNTTGEAYNLVNPGACTFFSDRAGSPVTVNTCTPTGPRGAAQADDLLRQQDKIVTAINTMDADIVSLEEIENSVALGEADRDDALSALVTALNVAAGSTRWAFVPSPAPADLPDLAEQDVIRTAFIYDPNTVELVGPSKVLVGSAPFTNAREPLAQAFKAVGSPDIEAFGVIVNHFKSKSATGATGDNLDTGQGGFNGDRVRQAQALAAFAEDFKTERGIEKMFLSGDFNSYSKEDPVQELEAAGYTRIESDTPGEESYSFSGLSGSLDHVFANDAAAATVSGADIWDINASESIAYQYSRHNYNVTQFFDGTTPYAASDHNPEIVGIDVASSMEIQILATNDFHGRLLNNATNGEAGAAVLSGAVKQLRGNNPNTVFAAAGDLIGASTFESFIQRDKPTIDALNEAGLEVSAAGNHEFDQGYDDLINRVLAPYDPVTNPLGGAEWEYIAANVRQRSDNSHALPESWIRDFGPVEVGFVGAVTEDLPSLVSPAGIAQLEVTDIVTEANAAADVLKAQGADVIVLLVHEGAATDAVASATDASAFGQIVNGVNPNIDAIVSGHTHLRYNHAIEVPEWVAEGRAVTTRPVVSAGQYGTYLNQLNFTVDYATSDVIAKTQNVLELKTGQVANYPADPAVVTIVDDAKAEADVLGAVELGRIAGPFNRAKLANGSTENRGAESTLGNLVAEVQRWATATPEAGSAQIAFMNPGGMRADLTGNPGGYPAAVTYKQAASVQPFANTLVNMQLTGAQIKTALEQQWQRDAAGNVPTRPFLRLGISAGFTYTYDPARPEGDRITGMWLGGAAIDPDGTYSVTVNSFLASGGDNFRAFAQGADKRDTGQIDLTAMVDYLDEFANATAGDPPLPVAYDQRSVGVSFPATAPASYPRGGHVLFNVSSLAFSTAPDLTDTQLSVSLGGTTLGTFPVDNTIGTAVFDEYGTAAVDVVVPAGTPNGRAVLVLTGNNTGTTTRVPIQVAPATTTVTGTAADLTYGTDGTLTVAVTPSTATGEVIVSDGGSVLGTVTLAGGTGELTIPGTALEPGTRTLTLQYGGDADNSPANGTATVVVLKAAATVDATASPTSVQVKKDTSTVTVNVGATGYAPTGTVSAFVNGQIVDTADLVSGTATLDTGLLATVGAQDVEIRYSGDSRTTAATATVSVTVVKQRPSMTVVRTPTVIRRNLTRALLTIDVAATNLVATGTVTVRVDGRLFATRTLVNGGTTVRLAPFARAGLHWVVVDYLGDANLEPVRVTRTLFVI